MSRLRAGCLALRIYVCLGLLSCALMSSARADEPSEAGPVAAGQWETPPDPGAQRQHAQTTSAATDGTGSQRALLARRREASSSLDGISAEEMSRAGAISASTALLRVTGVSLQDNAVPVVRGLDGQYSNLLLNNQLLPSFDLAQRSLPLDLFPAGLLESVSVQKTFTPDAQGDFGGGAVQLVTRGYPETRMFNVTLSSGLNTQATFRRNLTYSGGATDFLGFDDGGRALPHGLPARIQPKGAAGAGQSSAEIAALGARFPVNYQTHKELSLPDLSLMASGGDTFALRHAKLGFVAAAGYRSRTRVSNGQTVRDTANSLFLRDGSLDSSRRQIGLSSFLDWGVEFSSAQKLTFTTSLLRQTYDSTQFERVLDADVGATLQRTQLGWVENQLFDQQVRGSHTLHRAHDLAIDWRYSFARATRDQPDRRDYVYVEQAGGAPTASTASGDNQRLYDGLTENAHQGGLDLSLPFGIWSNLVAKAKAGGMVFWKKRNLTARRFEFRPISLQSGPPNQVFSADNILDGNVLFSETTAPSDAYEGTQRLDAAYGMLELRLRKNLELMAGARVEHSQTRWREADPTNGELVRHKFQTFDVLPAASLHLRFARDFAARLSYGRTVNRPTFQELRSAGYFDFDTGATVFGNPGLRRAKLHNLDARIEWYPAPHEVLAVGGFFKAIDAPILPVIQARPGGFAPTWENAASGTLGGIELEGQKRLGFVHPVLRAAFLGGNVSWIHSQASERFERSSNSPPDTQKSPLPGQSPWIVNLQLGYDDADGKTGATVTLLYNAFGRRVSARGNPLYDTPDQLEQSFQRVDLVYNQRLPHGLALGLRAENLLNATHRFTVGDVTVRKYKSGPSVYASLAYSYR